MIRLSFLSRRTSASPRAPGARPTRSLRALALRLSLALTAPTAALLAAATPTVVQADRFGQPEVARVVVEQATVYAGPDTTQPVGPLARDAIVVIALEQRGEWTRTPAGWIRASDVRTSVDPWTAEVSAESASVYGKPDAREGVRKVARRGDLLRVMGVTRDLGGGPDLWWGTTEGFVKLSTLQAATSDLAKSWTLPEAAEAPKGWWGQVQNANVRAAPSTDAPIVGEFAGGERVKVLAEAEGENVAGNTTWYRIDGGRYAGAYVHSSRIRRIADPAPSVVPPPAGAVLGDKPWVVVNRAAYTLTLMRNGQPQFSTYVALGKAGKDTPTGSYSTWGKYRADRMSSAFNPDAEAPYDLPSVPFVQYYLDGGYAIHGTYWHDLYGTDQSQGCINLTWTDAAYLFGQTLPTVASAGGEQQAATQDPATPVIILP